MDGPISAEVLSDDAEGMVREGVDLAHWDPHVVVKIPMTQEGLKAVKKLKELEIRTNVTLVFSASQALLAAEAGATYVSPFEVAWMILVRMAWHWCAILHKYFIMTTFRQKLLQHLYVDRSI